MKKNLLLSGVLYVIVGAQNALASDALDDAFNDHFKTMADAMERQGIHGLGALFRAQIRPHHHSPKASSGTPSASSHPSNPWPAEVDPLLPWHRKDNALEIWRLMDELGLDLSLSQRVAWIRSLVNEEKDKVRQVLEVIHPEIEGKRIPLLTLPNSTLTEEALKQTNDALSPFVHSIAHGYMTKYLTTLLSRIHATFPGLCTLDFFPEDISSQYPFYDNPALETALFDLFRALQEKDPHLLTPGLGGLLAQKMTTPKACADFLAYLNGMSWEEPKYNPSPVEASIDRIRYRNITSRHPFREPAEALRAFQEGTLPPEAYEAYRVICEKYAIVTEIEDRTYPIAVRRSLYFFCQQLAALRAVYPQTLAYDVYNAMWGRQLTADPSGFIASVATLQAQFPSVLTSSRMALMVRDLDQDITPALTYLKHHLTRFTDVEVTSFTDQGHFRRKPDQTAEDIISLMVNVPGMTINGAFDAYDKMKDLTYFTDTGWRRTSLSNIVEGYGHLKSHVMGTYSNVDLFKSFAPFLLERAAYKNGRPFGRERLSDMAVSVLRSNERITLGQMEDLLTFLSANDITSLPQTVALLNAIGVISRIHPDVPLKDLASLPEAVHDAGVLHTLALEIFPKDMTPMDKCKELGRLLANPDMGLSSVTPESAPGFLSRMGQQLLPQESSAAQPSGASSSTSSTTGASPENG